MYRPCCIKHEQWPSNHEADFEQNDWQTSVKTLPSLAVGNKLMSFCNLDRVDPRVIKTSDWGKVFRDINHEKNGTFVYSIPSSQHLLGNIIFLKANDFSPNVNFLNCDSTDVKCRYLQIIKFCVKFSKTETNILDSF